VLYPAYISIHAIESSSKQDDTKWLIYWVTFGIFTVIEFFSGLLTSVIPFYWLLKVSFVCLLKWFLKLNGIPSFPVCFPHLVHAAYGTERFHHYLRQAGATLLPETSRM